MSARLEELAWADTAIGELNLRRRREPLTGLEIYEVKLGDEFLMSSLFTVAEEELARLALARLTGDGLRVVVGGLGLGYTARAVLDDDRVAELVVVDALEPVITWHRDGLVPLGPGLTADPRCAFRHGDFFAISAAGDLGEGLDAVIVDIDHSPRHLLDGASSPFYRQDGTAALAGQLRPGGVYALWSNDPPDEAYLDILRTAFVEVSAEVVAFPNPLQGGTSTNTVYLASRPARRVRHDGP